MSAGVVASSHPLTTLGAYATDVIADSPLAYIRMDTVGSSGVMDDSSGNGRAFTLGAAQVTTGQPSLLSTDATNPSCYFNGGGGVNTNYVQDASQAAWQANIVAMECLFKSYSNPLQCIIDQDNDGGGPTRRFQLRWQSSGLAFGYWGSGGSGPTFIGGAASLSVNTTYHLAVALIGGVWTMLVNGSVYATSAGGQTFNSSVVSPLRIGAHANFNSAQPFYGLIDEVAFYGAGITLARLQSHAALR